MFPRLIFMSLVLMVLAGLGYGGYVLIQSRQPLPRATVLLDRGDPQAAQIVLRPLVRAEPRNALGHVLLARTQLDTSDPVAAEKELKIARALRFDRTVVNPLLARAYLAQGHFRDLLADIPATAPGDDELVSNLVLRSLAYIGMGEVMQAQASLSEAVRLKPADPDVLVATARLAAARGELTAARDTLDRVLSSAPEHLDALRAKGDVLNQLGDSGGALAALDKAVSLAPISIPTRMQRASLLIALDRDKEAQADVDASFWINWHENTVYYNNAVLMVRAGKYADAAIEWQKLAPVMDDMPRSYYYQALTWARQDHSESGLEMVMRYLRLQPNDPDALRLAAELELKLQRPERALAVLMRAEAAGVKAAWASDLVGRAYFAMGNLTEAVQRYGRASAAEPENKEYAAHLLAAQRLLSGGPGAGGGSDGKARTEAP